MLDRLIRFSLSQRGLVLALAAAVLFFGFRSAVELPVDVLPDLTKPTVTLLTEAPGYAPEEVETLVTIPLENTLMGINGVTRLRTTTDVGLSLIFVEFDWGTDIYQARQFVQERLAVALESLPEGVTPYMAPVSSLMGDIMLVGVTDPTGSMNPRDLRSYADWTVIRRLQSVPGIAEVLAMGGGVKQVQVQPDPERMLALGVSFDEVRDAAANAVSNTTGGFLTSRSREIMVRNLAMTTDLEEIGSTVVRHEGDRAVRIRDVADVVWGTEPMRGDAGVDDDLGVILSVKKSPGFDTIELSERVEQALAELQSAAPVGVKLTQVYRQADFIDVSITNLQDAIRDGAVMVAAVLFLFLLNARTTLITLMAIPLSLATSFAVFKLFGLSVNSMTLGGLAVAIGMVVDDAIVDVENVLRRLRERAASDASISKIETIARASAEVRGSILYATTLIILVFLPLLGLSGVEGRLFTPIAIATIVSMAASFVVSLTVIPVLASFLLSPKKEGGHGESGFVRGLKLLLRRSWLRLALHHPFVVMGFAGILLAFAFSLYPQMGNNFLPPFREPTALIATTTAPGTSLERTREIARVADRLLLSIPEVERVGWRLGRAEKGDHVVPVSTVEFDVEFHDEARPREEVLADIREKMSSLPGTFSAYSGPLGDRIGHMLSGVSAPVAVKVFGPELAEIRRIGLQIERLAHEIPGFEQAKGEQQAPIPQLRIQVDRERALAYGVTAGELNAELAALLGGQVVGEVYEGQKVFELVVRLPDDWRESPERLGNMRVRTQSGVAIPLKYVADLRPSTGPNTILRENTQRRFVVSIKPTTQDLVGSIEQLQRDVAAQVDLPEGYFVSFEGEYEAQQEASRRILFMALGVLFVIAFLLQNFFRTPVFALQVLFDIPLALIGGILLTRLTLDNISIATLVGFIAVAGIASRNSIMMISHYLHMMRHEGYEFGRDLIQRGTEERLVPVLMTALSAGLALLPLVFNLGFVPGLHESDPATAPGKEILNPVAVVIVGGLVTSTFLGLGVTPAVFWVFGRRAAEKAVRDKAPASA